ncbi:MAG TPA: cytochrome C oxidase subunit IV, partial [Candidatus Aquiluna sp.]|nr:cytochrome C oxidase subunit IV [Aquiluna sp.]
AVPGWWLTFIALPFAVVAVVGFVYEYSRGAHAH